MGNDYRNPSVVSRFPACLTIVKFFKGKKKLYSNREKGWDLGQRNGYSIDFAGTQERERERGGGVKGQRERERVKIKRNTCGLMEALQIDTSKKGTRLTL